MSETKQQTPPRATLLHVSTDTVDRVLAEKIAAEAARVSYVPPSDRAGGFRAAGIADTSVWAIVCSIAYDTRPQDGVASGDVKQASKLISKAIRTKLTALAADAAQPVPAYAAKCASVVARALAWQVVAPGGERGGIVAALPANAAGPEFYGKSFVEKRDETEKEPESAPACLARLAKAYAPHRGSRIPPGTGDGEEVQALMLACAQALGWIATDGQPTAEDLAERALEVARAQAAREAVNA